MEPAAALARELDLPLIDSPSVDYDLLLAWTGARLELRDNRDPRVGAVFTDFAALARGTPLTARQPLARAIGKAARTVVDATTGLAQDSFRLACYGYQVLAIERRPVVAALVRDGLDRLEQMNQPPRKDARPHPSPLPGGEGADSFTRPPLRLIAGESANSASLHRAPRLLPVGESANSASLHRAPRLLPVGDARAILPTLDPAPDVIYLDPMFPPKRRRSAAVSKELRLLRLLAGEDSDAHELFEVARRVARQRVVVKRPDHALPLAPRPTVSYGGKLVRYDVYRVDTKRKP
jgi:16S rRNA (guanine1516-N2)-methyltransferase